MKFFLKICLLLLMMNIFSFAFAGVESKYFFGSPIVEQRFQKLLGELRCVVCQNQSLAESNAPLAQDLKKEVYDQIQSGYSDQQIKNYLVQRYGEYILFKPSINRITFILWLGPLIFLFGAFLIMYLSIKRQSKALPQQVG